MHLTSHNRCVSHRSPTGLPTRRASAVCGALVSLAAAAIALGAEIELKDGARISGKILKQSADGVEVETGGMTVAIPKLHILRIDGKLVKVDYVGVYEAKAKEVFSHDVAGRLRLAEWCKEHGLYRQMALEILAVVREEPKNEYARTLLGEPRKNAAAEELLAHAIVAHTDRKYAKLRTVLALLRKKFSRSPAYRAHVERIKQMGRDVQWEFSSPLEKLREYARTQRWSEGRARFDADLDAFAQGDDVEDAKTLREIFMCCRACEYLPLIKPRENAGAKRDLAAWLVAHPTFAEKFLQTIVPRDRPEKALSVLTSLHSRYGDKLLRHGDLPLAFAVVWDSFAPKQCDLLSSYDYYVSGRRHMIFDFRKLPCFLLKFVVDTPTSLDERAWAVRRYGKRHNIGKVFFDVPYDIWSLKGYPKKIKSHPYTLPNLVEYGGVCVDQAYFAANVAKSLGVPAARIGGVGERGGHAWVGYVGWDGKHYVWNLNTGRYASDHYYVGRTRDPQTRRRITDHTLALDSVSANIGWPRVTDAQNYLELARRTLARQEDKRAVHLLDLAIKRNPYDRLVWEEAARLSQRGVIDVEKADDLMQFVLKGFADHLDFSIGIFWRLIEIVPDADLKKRNRLYEAAFQVYQSRPDLGVKLRTAQGDYLAKHGHRKLCYAVYYDAIERYLDHGRLVAGLTRKVVKMNLEDGEPRKALNLIVKLLAYCKEPPYEDPFAGASAYYQLHKTLAKLYRDLGNEAAAVAVEAKLKNYIHARRQEFVPRPRAVEAPTKETCRCSRRQFRTAKLLSSSPRRTAFVRVRVERWRTTERPEVLRLQLHLSGSFVGENSETVDNMLRRARNLQRCLRGRMGGVVRRDA